MDIISHVDCGKKELAKDVHSLGNLDVRLSSSKESAILVHNDSESSLVVNVKGKKDMDPTLIGLKQLVVNKKIEVFSPRENEVLHYEC